MAHHGLLALRKTRQLLSAILRAILNWKVCLVAQSCPALCSPLDGSLSGFSAHGIFQARILEWGTISLSRASSQPKDQTCISCVFWIAGRFFTHWAISAEAPFWTEKSPAKSTEMGKMWHSTQVMKRTHVHSVRAEIAPHSPHLGMRVLRNSDVFPAVHTCVSDLKVGGNKFQWVGALAHVGSRKGEARCAHSSRSPAPSPGLWLSVLQKSNPEDQGHTALWICQEPPCVKYLLNWVDLHVMEPGWPF